MTDMLQNDTLVLCFSLNTVFKNVTQMQREEKKRWGRRRGGCDSGSEGHKKRKTGMGVSFKIVCVHFVSPSLPSVAFTYIFGGCEKPTGDNHPSLVLFLPPSFFIVSLGVGLCGGEWWADPSSSLRTDTWLSSQTASGSRSRHVNNSF